MSTTASAREVNFIIDEATGQLTIEGLSRREIDEYAGDLLPEPKDVNCARPLAPPDVALPESGAGATTARVHRLYHNSVCDGPGRRSVIQMQGCSIRCDFCFVPQTHGFGGGVLADVGDIVRHALAPEGEPRDGVTVTGGEPFDQPAALAAILRELKARGVHTIVYTGHTVEGLRERRQAETDEALRLADIIVDGPFVVGLSRGATGWRGSTNQRTIQLTREADSAQ